MKGVICDLDGTLIKARFYKVFSSPSWRSFCGYVVSLFPLWFQLILAKPKLLNIKAVKEEQEEGKEIFVVTARKEFNNSKKKLKTLLERIGLEVKEDNIVMKNNRVSTLDYKKEEFKKIKEECKEVEILEDEENLYKELGKIGSIVEIIS